MQSNIDIDIDRFVHIHSKAQKDRTDVAAVVALPSCLVLIGRHQSGCSMFASPVIAKVPEFQTLLPFIQQTRGTMLSAVDAYNRPTVAAEWRGSEPSIDKTWQA